FVRSSVSFGYRCVRNASYVNFSKKWTRNNDSREITASTSLVQNGVRSIRASKLTVDNIKDYDENIGCPICRRNITFTYKVLNNSMKYVLFAGVLPKLSPILIRELESQKQAQE
ncbi:uncharacterized protein LOC113681424, partial [Pocillopora damicornis]|uniref:uncharacterized protein LOC113681424 n=1 Tax=Pocillopora damicornis TaxID=46731 RepID=UPI000F553211